MLRILRQIFGKRVGPFRVTSSGRCGTIIYEEDGKTLEMVWELPGTSGIDFLMCPIDLRHWTSPKETPIPIAEQLALLKRLREWFQIRGYRSDVDLPKNSKQSQETCMWAGCEQQSFEGLAVCPSHFDLNLLRSE